MALDAVDKEWIRDELRHSETALGDKIKLVQSSINQHLTDRFAHGWDHQLLETSRITVKDWEKWRDDMDKWRWMITGALIIISIEVPVVVSVGLAILHH